MKYSAVIVTYNRLELLKNCISHVLQQKLPFDSIIIINNASTDGTKKYLEQYENEDKIIIINEATNGGGANGFYTGIKRALDLDCEWVLVIDDDAMINDDFMSNISLFVDKYKEILAFSGVVKTEDIIDLSHRRRFKKGINFKETVVAVGEYGNDFFLYNLASFCGLVINKKIINKIGLPKKDYFIWYDDTEYSMRINKFTQIMNVNSAELNHCVKKNEIGNKMPSWKTYYGMRNLIDMVNIHLGPSYTFKYFAILFIAMIKALLLYLLRNKREVNKYKIKLYYSILVDSLHGRLGINKKYLP